MATIHQFRPAASELSDAELVEAARSKLPWAKEQLYRRYSNTVFGLAVRLAGPRDARDITQDVFLEAFQALASLLEPEALKSWLCGITVHVARRRLRRRKLFERFFRRDESEMADAISSSATPDVALELQQAYGLIACLPERLRTAFLLRRIEGMTAPEVATAMGVSIASVKRWVADVEIRIARATPPTPEVAP